MGHINQMLYLEGLMPEAAGPVLEIGSRDYGNTSSFRDHYDGNEYVGVDMTPGDGVDCVLDLTQGTGDLPRGHFALGICCSVLEHVRQPWLLAENVTALIRPGGSLYMSVPWVWRYHPYPDDYYRFSWRGVVELFPQFDWNHIRYASEVRGEFFDVAEADGKIDSRLGIRRRTLRGRRKYLPCLMVNMLGSKR